MLAFVSGTGVLPGTLTSFFLQLVKRSQHEHAVRFLGLYTLSLTVGLAEPLIPAGNLLLRYAAGGVSLLYGPFLYLYCQHRVDADRRTLSSRLSSTFVRPCLGCLSRGVIDLHPGGCLPDLILIALLNTETMHAEKMVE